MSRAYRIRVRESLKRVIESIRPEDRPAVNQKLWTYYPTDSAWKSPGDTGRPRQPGPAAFFRG